MLCLWAMQVPGEKIRYRVGFESWCSASGLHGGSRSGRPGGVMVVIIAVGGLAWFLRRR